MQNFPWSYISLPNRTKPRAEAVFHKKTAGKLESLTPILLQVQTLGLESLPLPAAKQISQMLAAIFDFSQ